MVEKREVLFTIGEVGEILGSKAEGDPRFHRTSVTGVSIDSRTVKESDLFVALKGENHDGHDYLEQAFAKGAIAAMVSKEKTSSRHLNGPQYIAVDKTLDALGELARSYRAKMPARVVAITGSNGKTTVKNMVYEILSREGSAVKSPGNFNNLVGLPLSIFEMRKTHKTAVFELGMSARGEIRRLGEIASPDVGVITNVGPVHLEFLRNVEEVAEAKLELIPHIRKDGTLVFNGDDRMLSSRIKADDFKITRFGLSVGNDVHPVDLKFDNEQMPRFVIRADRINLRLPGIHNVYNALAAYAVARALGIKESTAAAAINSSRPEAMRSEVIHKGAVTLLVDCYNANPISMKYAIDTLAKTMCRGQRIAVLADMLELGESGRKYHEETGEHAQKQKIDYLFGYGPLSKYMVERFGDGGRHFEKKEDLIERLLEIISRGDVVLFKGSRGMALEDVVEAVKKNL